MYFYALLFLFDKFFTNQILFKNKKNILLKLNKKNKIK